MYTFACHILVQLLLTIPELSGKLYPKYVLCPTVLTHKKMSKVHIKCEQIMLSNLCLISAAVQRKYESMRRQWKAEDRDDFVEASRKSSLMKKYRSRRKRVSY